MAKKQKTPEPPKESQEVIVARQRQITDLARLDEEENKRIKQMRAASRGVRAFRAMRSGRSTGSTRASGRVASNGAAAISGSDAAQMQFMHQLFNFFN
jgi:hypothetical protein